MAKYKYIGSLNSEEIWQHTEEGLLCDDEIIDIVRMHGQAKEHKEVDIDELTEDSCSHLNNYVLVYLDTDNEPYQYDLYMLVVTDKNGKELHDGDNVRWYDPDKSARDLTRIYQVYSVGEEIVIIGDGYSEAETLPNELEVVE